MVVPVSEGAMEQSVQEIVSVGFMDTELVGVCFTCRKPFRLTIPAELLTAVYAGGKQWARTPYAKRNECSCYQLIQWVDGKFLSVDNNPCLEPMRCSAWY